MSRPMFGQESSPSEAGFPKEGQRGGEKCKTLANSRLKKHEVGQGPGPRAPRYCGYGAQRTRRRGGGVVRKVRAAVRVGLRARHGALGQSYRPSGVAAR